LLAVKFVYNSTLLFYPCRYSCCRKYFCRCSNYKEEVTRCQDILNFIKVLYSFAKEDDVRFERIGAELALWYIFHAVVTLNHRYGVSALQAMEMMVISMNFQNIFAACRLVQPVDILGDKSGQKIVGFKLSQDMVGFIGLFS